MNNKKLIEETYKFISEFNPEHFSYTDFDCDGNCEPDMKEFAETIKNFMEHICDSSTDTDKEDIDEWIICTGSFGSSRGL